VRDHLGGAPGIPKRRPRFDDDDSPRYLKHRRSNASAPSDVDTPETGDRWSTWDGAQHGPEPYPDWLPTELAAVDTELGLVKTGKEADVHLVERAVPGAGPSCLLAAKRYRRSEHRLFHRDAGYLEGRRVRESRVTRAMANRSDFGREILAGQWAAAEFDALGRLWQLGAELDSVIVPYPVQLAGTELMLEFVGDADGVAAPRLAQLRPRGEELTDLWRQLTDALAVLARAGLAHGDLSAYNILVHNGRLVLIDLPQVVDVVVNPQGPQFLARDVRVVCSWFVARGLSPALADPAELTAALLADAGMR
jgi:RIO kinase 1